MPPSVVARRCHSRSVAAWRRASLNCRWSIARFAARIDDERAGEDDDDVDAVRGGPAGERRADPSGFVDAEARQRERDAGERGHAVGEQRQRPDQLLRARVHGRAVFGADDVERAEQRRTTTSAIGRRGRRRAAIDE